MAVTRTSTCDGRNDLRNDGLMVSVKELQAGLPSGSFARVYAEGRPRLTPPLMQRVGGGFKELPPSVFDEVASLNAVAERLRGDKERADATLRDRDTELERVKAEVHGAVERAARAEERDTQREAMLGGELHRVCEQLEEARRQLVQERTAAKAERE
eukprot:791805-Prymnesium_polylepis.1